MWLLQGFEDLRKQKRPFRGGALLKICSSLVGAYSRGGGDN